MKKVIFLVSLSFLLYSLTVAQSQIQKIQMKDKNWEYVEGNVKFVKYEGVAAMKSLSHAPKITAKNVMFTDGTIEFDVAFDDSQFVSIYFRQQDEQESECFYLRTERAGNPMAMDAIQYSSIVKGVNLWDLQGQYQAAAPLKANEWNHIKLVVSGKQMLVYVNNMDRPTLYIPHLEGNTDQGGIAVEGKGYFANLTIEHREIAGLSPDSGYDPTSNDPRYLRNWQVSAPLPLPFGQDVIGSPTFPSDTTTWNFITSERLGLINLTRICGADPNGVRRVTWIKTSIYSASDQIRKLHLGFSDEVWVFINNQLLYLDKNYYNQPIMKQPNGRISIENTTFDLPLGEGDNELLIGVGNFFYGWGVIARLDALDGLKLE